MKMHSKMWLQKKTVNEMRDTISTGKNGEKTRNDCTDFTH